MGDVALFKSILVPTDGSEHSVAAGKLAIELAITHKSRLAFIYILDDSVVEEMARASGQTLAETSRELAENGNRYLTYLCDLAQKQGIEAARVIREGTPHTQIVAEAKRQKADLIVIGHVGRRGPRRILIGSVTERVIEYSECHVLVAKRC
jgi:nucleotide-binding universal stress UspA family protein